MTSKGLMLHATSRESEKYSAKACKANFNSIQFKFGFRLHLQVLKIMCPHDSSCWRHGPLWPVQRSLGSSPHPPRILSISSHILACPSQRHQTSKHSDIDSTA